MPTPTGPISERAPLRRALLKTYESICEIFEDRDKVPNGDFQGTLEAALTILVIDTWNEATTAAALSCHQSTRERVVFTVDLDDVQEHARLELTEDEKIDALDRWRKRFLRDVPEMMETLEDEVQTVISNRQTDIFSMEGAENENHSL
jgi:hypothetical protein